MPAKRLYRSRGDQIVGGVCAGLADYFDVDPVLVRLSAAGITIFGFPFTIIGYIVCWIVIPEEPRSRPAQPPGSSPPPPGPDTAGDTQGMSMGLDAPGAADPPGGEPSPAAGAADPAPHVDSSREAGAHHSSRTGGCVLVMIGLFFLMINLDLFDWDDLRFWRWRFFLPLLLIGFGLWLLVRAFVPSRGPDQEG